MWGGSEVGDTTPIQVQDHAGGNHPFGLRVLSECQTLQGVGRQQRRGLERRQSFWPDDNYSGRFEETIIWYLGGAGFDHGPTGSFTEGRS